MRRGYHPPERHRGGHAAWLRAAVLGANDGIVSTASLVVGMAAANAAHGQLLLAGMAGLVGGAMSMAAGEYVSVSSQADAERADLAKERQELREFPEGEHRELVGIYVQRGIEPALAEQVATQLAAHDALGAHARDELGITETLRAAVAGGAGLGGGLRGGRDAPDGDRLPGSAGRRWPLGDRAFAGMPGRAGRRRGLG